MGDVQTLLHHSIDRLQGTSAFTRSDSQLLDDVAELQTAITRLHALLATRVHEIDARGLPVQASSTRRFVAERLRITDGTARRLVELGEALALRPLLADAMAAGAVSVQVAPVIADALQAIDDAVPAELVAKAEQALLDSAALGLGPREMLLCGRRVLHLLAPDLANRIDDARRARDAELAAARRELTIGPAVAGSHRVHGWLDPDTAAVLTGVIEPLARPLHGPDQVRDDRPARQRRADAAVEVFRAYAALGPLPEHGGRRPQLAVTVNYHQLVGELCAGGLLDTGQPLTAETARRLACDAQITPIVLGGAGQVLDVGRSRRLYDRPLRRALVERDRGCAFPGCPRPPGLTDAHHIHSWLDGGPTSLHNGVLLCLAHHKEIHRGHWTVHLGADDIPDFVPPVHVDLWQRPRRNFIHRPQHTLHPA